jgi:hypothetical protein
VLLLALRSEIGFSAAKKVEYRPNAPALNIHFWAVDPYQQKFVYTSPDGKIVKEILLKYASDADLALIDDFVALPFDHAAFLGTLIATGCLSWSKTAHREAQEWNSKNPHQKMSLKSAKK